MKEEVLNALRKAKACPAGLEFAAQFNTLQEAWDKCQAPSFLLWVLSRFDWRNNLEGIVKLAKKWANATANADAAYAANRNANVYARDAAYAAAYANRAAVNAAANADAAARAVATNATYAARVAANTAAYSVSACRLQCDDIRKLFPNPPEIT